MSHSTDDKQPLALAHIGEWTEKPTRLLHHNSVLRAADDVILESHPGLSTDGNTVGLDGFILHAKGNTKMALPFLRGEIEWCLEDFIVESPKRSEGNWSSKATCVSSVRK
jgi:hypothetical protein